MTCPNCNREMALDAAHCVCGYGLPGLASANELATALPPQPPRSPRRSIGVTVSAIAAICGGPFMLLFILVMFALPPDKIPTSSLWLGAVIYGGLGLLSVLTGIGLLRLHPWARMSVLIFSGCVLYGGIVLLLIALIEPPPEIVASTAIMILVGVMVLLTQGTGVCWLLFFRKQSVRTQFLTQEKPSPRPASITVIAVLLIIGSVLSLPSLLGSNSVATLLNFVITGWAGRVILGTQAALSFYCGWGLLRLREPARKVAIFLNAVYVINLAPFVLPGASELSQALYAAMQPAKDSSASAEQMHPAFMMFFIAQGILIALISLWVLHTRRAAFSPVDTINPAVEAQS